MRILAVPVSSVVEVPESDNVSGNPAAEVMIRMSPDTTSKRTTRARNGTPLMPRPTFTPASPPEHIAVPHAADWLALGVIVTTLLTVRGFTTSAAVTGVDPPVSLTVSVMGVSAATGPGTIVSWLPVKTPTMGMTNWLLEVMTYWPLPPVMMKAVGRSEYSVAAAGEIDSGPGVTTTGGLPTAPLHDASVAKASRASASRASRSAMPGKKRITRFPDVVGSD